MGLIYTWQLKSLKKQQTNTLDNAIIGTQWKLIGANEEGTSGSFNGATPFDLKSIQTGSFIPYEELTEEIVLSWIKEHVSGSTMSNYMHHINEVIHKEIDMQIFPKVEVGAEDMPWSPVSGSGPTPSPTMAAPL
jgi:hypothetical protein